MKFHAGLTPLSLIFFHQRRGPTGSRGAENAEKKILSWAFVLVLFISLNFFPQLLFASVNEPWRMQLLTGYRNDTITGLENVQFWDNELAVRVIHRDLLFYARGGGSVFNGWAVDGLAHLGYAVNLTPDRTYDAMVIPLVGFSGHYEHVQSFSQTWYGPYVGAGIRVKPGNRLIFDLGYAYNFLNLDGSHGQSGWAEMSYMINNAWQIGLMGTINYFFSSNLRWTPVSGFVTISRSL